MNEIITISGIDCYEKDGTAYLRLEAVARGLGFTEVKEGKEYVMWRRIDRYLSDFGFGTSAERPDFIPENIFYRLAMKARNEVAEAFQAKVADEIIPSIRKHGAYMTPDTIEAALLNPDMLIRLATQLKDEQTKNKQLTAEVSALTVDKAIMQPKADYFDDLVDRNLLTNFRATAKLLGVKQKKFINFLLEHKYIYRDQKGALQAYAKHKTDGLFENKECFNEKSTWKGTQTMITPKGRETFRLLCQGL